MRKLNRESCANQERTRRCNRRRISQTMSLHQVWEDARGGRTESQKTCLVQQVIHPGTVKG